MSTPLDFDALERSIRDRLAGIGADLDAYRAGVPTPSPTWRVRAGENLHAALDAGGAIELEAGATFESQGYHLTHPGTSLVGHGATLVGQSLPALTVMPGAHGVHVSGLYGASRADSAFLFGLNTNAQTRREDVPRDLVVTDLQVHGHRGKRAYEINAIGDFTSLLCRDCWGPGIESKGINVINTPGPVFMTEADIEAGSIGFLCGGDPVDIIETPAMLPQVFLRRSRFFRPPAWRTDGQVRSVKTGIEFKSGRDCLVEDCLVDGVWTDGQNGFGCTVTPRSGASTVGIRFQNVRLINCTNGYNVTGHDGATVTPEMTDRLEILGGSIVTDRALVKPGLSPGRGTALQLTSGPLGAILIGKLVAVVQHSLIYHAEPSAIDALEVLGNTWQYGSYGLFLANTAHGGNLTTLGLIDVTGNVIAGAPASFGRVFPSNQYLGAEAFAALEQVKAAKAVSAA